MVTIIQGEDAEFTIKLRDQDGDPFDLTNFDQYKVCLPGAAGTPIEITEVANANGSSVALLGSPLLGKLEVTLSSTDTGLLALADEGDIFVTLNNSVTPKSRKARFLSVLSVYESGC